MTKSMNSALLCAFCLVGAQFAVAKDAVPQEMPDVFAQATTVVKNAGPALQLAAQSGAPAAAAPQSPVPFGKYCGNGKDRFIGGRQWDLINYCYDVQPGDNPATVIFGYPEPVSWEPLAVKTVFSPDLTYRIFEKETGTDVGVGYCEIKPNGLLCHSFVVHAFTYSSAENHALITKNPSNGKDQIVVHGEGYYNWSKAKTVWDVTMDRQ